MRRLRRRLRSIPAGGNSLISVTAGGLTTQFIYDGDGDLVKKIKTDGSKTLYPSTSPRKAAAPLRAGVGGIYEVDKNAGGTVANTKTYYPAAGATLASAGTPVLPLRYEDAAQWGTVPGSAGVRVG